MNLIKFEGYDIQVLNEDGTQWDGQQDAWFIPKEIAEAIGAKESRKYSSKILSRNPEKFEGFRGVTKMTTPSGLQEVNIINENGLYMFLMASNLPQAISFQRQVSEVIKLVRKEKLSEVLGLPKTYKEALLALVGQVEENEKLQGQIEESKPKVELFHRMISAENNQTMNEVAKSLKWGRNKLFALLRDEGILMWNNLPYQRYIDSGYFFVREVTKNNLNIPQTLVTPKGLEFVANVTRKSEESSRGLALI